MAARTPHSGAVNWQNAGSVCVGANPLQRSLVRRILRGLLFLVPLGVLFVVIIGGNGGFGGYGNIIIHILF